jgi:hypothetical protein
MLISIKIDRVAAITSFGGPRRRIALAVAGADVTPVTSGTALAD